jgi:hypothetical protein
MIVRLILLCLFMLVLGTQLQAQSKRKKKSKNKQENVTSVDPSFPQEGKYQPKTKKASRKNRGITYNAQDNFYQQRERVQKDIRRAGVIETTKQQSTIFRTEAPAKKTPARQNEVLQSLRT